MVTRTYEGKTATLSYDSNNRLVRWDGDIHEWYAYDGSGSRQLRRSTTVSGTNITVYAFGMEEHVYDGAGAHQHDTFYYSFGGHLIAKSDGTQTQFFLTDELNSVISSFDSNGTVLGNRAYGPYGNTLYNAGSTGTEKGYTGQYQDGTGLDYYNARYYDPVVGIFISPDSVQGNPQGMNPYAYVKGNPETFTDPSGHRFVGVGDGGSYNITYQNGLSEIQQGITWEDFTRFKHITNHACIYCQEHHILASHKMHRVIHNLLAVSESVDIFNRKQFERARAIYEQGSLKYREDYKQWLPLTKN